MDSLCSWLSWKNDVRVVPAPPAAACRAVHRSALFLSRLTMCCLISLVSKCSPLSKNRLPVCHFVLIQISLMHRRLPPQQCLLHRGKLGSAQCLVSRGMNLRVTV
jgi:hypothetical protein